MTPHEAAQIVGMLGWRLSAEGTGGRDMKALLVLVGSSESPAADLAAALGAPEDTIESAYNDVVAIRRSEVGAQQALAAKRRRDAEG